MMKASSSSSALIYVVLVVALVAQNTSGFTLKTLDVVGSRIARINNNLGLPAGRLFSTRKEDDELFPKEEYGEYTGDVDWDAEWKKVMAKQGEPSEERPGKDFYKSEAEIAAIRAANKAQNEIQKVQSKMPSPPSMDIPSLTGDWRVRTFLCVCERRYKFYSIFLCLDHLFNFEILKFIWYLTTSFLLFCILSVLDCHFGFNQCGICCTFCWS